MTILTHSPFGGWFRKPFGKLFQAPARRRPVSYTHLGEICGVSSAGGFFGAVFPPRGHLPLALWDLVPVGLSGSGFAGSVLGALSPWGSKAFQTGAILSLSLIHI